MTRRRSTEERLKELEYLVDDVTRRNMVVQALFATSLGMLLRQIPDALRAEMMRELRACTYFETSAPDPLRAETAALELEESFDGMLDMVEHIARATQQ
ncbi:MULTISPECIES: hypothetical protein [Bradyrhizobium]|uniref:hypothetical protein n=1 Tax=Bradyrhizobium TaxID=374 RepID=UPI0004B13256|nr:MULTISPECIES: hypothetical protein [unclassified Bradyrhizobium]MDA9465338.1 hypothetical protein [Bradyrhizobium sp. CCBAU 53415]MDA9469626.1 hypothetical protein [Bradyrhizobium sp. CCBAU 53415]